MAAQQEGPTGWQLYVEGSLYVVIFHRRPLGMLVEDRGGICTVVELQNEEDGRAGQAAMSGVAVDDAIVSLGNVDTRRLEFGQLTERIRASQVPFSIGFLRHMKNHRALTPPPPNMGLALSGRYGPLPTRPGAGGPIPMLAGMIPGSSSAGARDWSNKLPQHQQQPSAPTLIRPRPVVPAPGGAAASALQRGPPDLPTGKRGGKRAGEAEDDNGRGAAGQQQRQVKPRAGPGGAGGAGGGAAAALGGAAGGGGLDAITGALDKMLEDHGRSVIGAFLDEPQDEDDEEEEEEGGEAEGAGEEDGQEQSAAKEGKRKRGRPPRRQVKRSNRSYANRAAMMMVEGRDGQRQPMSQVIETAKLRHKRVRDALLESNKASDDLYEFSRALLLRGEAIHRLESRITELLQVRAIDVREKVQDLRALEGGSGGGVSEALRNKWNEVNEQRGEQLQFKRQVLDRGFTELERLVTDALPKACRRVEAELQLRLSELEQLLTGFHDMQLALAPPDEPLPAPSSSSAAVKTEATSRPHLLSAAYHHHHHHHSSSGSLGDRSESSTPSPPEYKPPKLGPEFQLPCPSLPLPWAQDPALASSTSMARPPLAKDGDAMCRWKPPAPGQPGMPTDEEVAELVSSFRPELEETVLWELYKRGWDVSSTLTAVKQQLMSGTLKKETPVDPLSRAEVPVFEKAMAERWKDFAHAARTVGRKSVKSCVVHYYNHFKRSESYKRLKPRSDSPESQQPAPPPPPATTSANATTASSSTSNTRRNPARG